MQEIFVCCGLGDCILYCQIYNLYKSNFKYSYVLNTNFVVFFRSENFITYIINIFSLFNVPLKIISYINPSGKVDLSLYTPPNVLLNEYPINNVTLSQFIPNCNLSLPDKYIVICLNYRLVKNVIPENKINVMIEKICNSINNNNFRLPIVVIGHRNSYYSKGVFNNSFYNKLNVNKIIDKSYDGNLLIEPNVNNLIYDINVIKNANETFQFGIGGSLCMNCIFSKSVNCITNPSEISLGSDIDIYENCFINICDNITNYKNGEQILNKLESFLI